MYDIQEEPAAANLLQGKHRPEWHAGERSFERGKRAGEGGADGITDGLEDVAALVVDGLTQQRVVAAEGTLQRGALLLPARSGAFDVSEE